MALTVPSKKKIFIHVPKTGGTWVRRYIYACEPMADETGPFEIEDHFGLAEVREAHPELDDWSTFGFVRKPETWYPSRWAWGKLTDFNSKRRNDQAAARHWMAQVWDEDFNRFIENILDYRHPFAAETFEGKLSRSLTGGGQEWAQVLRYENLLFDTMKAIEGPMLDIPRQKPGAFKLNPALYQLQINQLRRLEADVYKRWYRDGEGNVLAAGGAIREAPSSNG